MNPPTTWIWICATHWRCALQAYTGAVLIVAHDRDLLEKIVDELWVVQDGTLSTYDGNLEEYTAGRLSMDSSEDTGDQPDSAPVSKKSSAGSRPHRAVLWPI